jgi:single-strand DNA-binding protein
MNETMTTIVGNVISDVRHRRLNDGVEVANFRVASNERRFDKASAQWVDGDRLFVSVTCWRRLAGSVLTSLAKGDPVLLIGRLYTRNFELDGQKRSITELEAVAVGPDLSRCSAGVQRARRLGMEDTGVEAGPEPGGRPMVPLQADGSESEAELAADRAHAAEMEVVGGPQA